MKGPLIATTAMQGHLATGSARRTASSFTSSREAKDVDRGHGERLEQDHSRWMQTSQVLVLAAPGSTQAKDDVIREASLLYGQDCSEDEQRSLIPAIFRLVLVSMQTLCQQSDRFSPIPDDSPVLVYKLLLEQASGGMSNHSPLLEAVRCLWLDRHIQLTYAQRSLFSLSPSASYFFDRLGVICESSYVPEQEDVVRVRQDNASGIVQHDCCIDGNSIALIDVGRHRSIHSNSKWLHQFEHCTAVIYVIDFASYDQPHPADGRSCLQHAIEDFAVQCNVRWFRSTPFILLLSNVSQFLSNLGDRPLSRFLPAYDGDGGYDSSREWLLEQLRAGNRDPDRAVHTASGDDHFASSFEAIKQIIIRRSLDEAGIVDDFWSKEAQPSAPSTPAQVASTLATRLPALSHTSKSAAPSTSRWQRWKSGWASRAESSSAQILSAVTPAVETGQPKAAPISADERLQRGTDITPPSAEQPRSTATLLVMGAANSGKDELIQQVSANYGTKHSEHERRSQLPAIFRLVLLSMQALVVHSNRIHPILANSPVYPCKRRLEQVTSDESNQAELVEAVRLLWGNHNIQHSFQQLPLLPQWSSAHYFFDRIDVLCQESYVPTELDIEQLTRLAGGFVESVCTIDNISLKFIDGGQHSGKGGDNTKWLHHFDQVTCVIFVADLSSYDQPHPDDGVSCLRHAIDNFAAKCNSRAFRSTPFIVLLNKRDVFEKKLQTTPLSRLFPSYQGDGSCDSACAHVYDEFRARRPDDYCQVYILTAATTTDMEWMGALFNSVKDIIIRQALQEAGLVDDVHPKGQRLQLEEPAAAPVPSASKTTTTAVTVPSAKRASRWKPWQTWRATHATGTPTEGSSAAASGSIRKTPSNRSAASSDVALPTEQAESVLLSQLREWQEVQSLTSHLPFLERARACEADLAALVSAQQSRSSWSRARAAILSDPLLSSYSTYFQLTLIDVMTACKAIHSGWVSCGYTDMKDWLIAAFEITLDLVPVSIPGSGFLTAALQFANDRPKAHAVNAMAVWCISHDDWAVFVQQLAVLVCGVKREAIAKEGKGDKEKGVMGRMMEGGKAAMRALMVDDKHSALRRMADTDARRVCWAIMQEAVRPLHSLDERDVHAALQQAVWAVMEGRYSKQEWVEGSPMGGAIAVVRVSESSAACALSPSQVGGQPRPPSPAVLAVPVIAEQVQVHVRAVPVCADAEERKPALHLQVKEEQRMDSRTKDEVGEAWSSLSTTTLASPLSAADFAEWTVRMSAEMAVRQQREAELTAKLEEQMRQREEDKRKHSEEQRRLEQRLQQLTLHSPRQTDSAIDAGPLAFAVAECSPHSAQQMQASERRLKREVAQLGQQVSLLTEEVQRVTEALRRPRSAFFSPTSSAEDSEEEEEREREQEEQRAARMAQLTQAKKASEGGLTARPADVDRRAQRR